MYSLKSESIVLSPSVQFYLKQLTKNINFDIVVTSGTRSARQQAQAMFTKIELGDSTLRVYRDRKFAQSIIDVFPNILDATKIVEQYASSGGGSSHLRGLGVDIRSRNLTDRQIQSIIDVSTTLNANAILERTPPHIHITVEPNEKKNLFILLIPLAILIYNRFNK